jgi:hypothetical protein
LSTSSPLLVSPEQVNGERACPLGDRHVVVVRQAHQEARGINRALGEKAHQAARTLLANGRGHHEHRVVEATGQSLQRLCVLHESQV